MIKVQTKKLKLMMSVILSFEIVLQPLLVHSTPLKTHSNFNSNSYLQSHSDPILQKFIESQPTSDFKITFDKNDPAIDQDPFFMRAQKWTIQKSKVNQLSYLKNDQSLEILLPKSEKSLTLQIPLIPIQATEDFIFFSLSDTSDLFKKASGKNEKIGEGIFYLSRADLKHQLSENIPAPIFFFPLSGQGWTGNLNSLTLAQLNTIVIGNKKESVSIELQDVEAIMKAQKINLMIASSLTAKNRQSVQKEMYPAPGMTAAFGLFFTGIDLIMPEKSLWINNKADAFNTNHWLQPLYKKISNYLPLAMNKAHAFVDLPPELISRLIFVGTVLTGMLAASVIIKYAHPATRKKIAALRTTSEPIKNPTKLIQREIKETFDVFAAVTSTSAQIATVTFANSLELFLDKMAPTIASADHTIIRRFLNNSFYFTRNSLKNIPVNSRTFVLGALVMGGVDTAMVAIQYMIVVPMMALALSPHVSESMQNKINDVFSPSNPKTKEIALHDTVRTGIAYIQSGASSYSNEAKAQVIDAVTKEVEEEMRSRGLDPLSPENQKEKEDKITQKINITMKQKGLPDQSQFLFDASTLFSAIPKALGYNAPEDLQYSESFVLQKRFGLSKNALSKAILVAREWAQDDQSETARESLAILEETLDSFSFLKNIKENGSQGLSNARKARQQLTLLSYEGSIQYAIKYLPETWTKKYSQQAAQAASLMFRQALYSYLSNEGDDLILTNKKNIQKFSEKAKLIAFEELKKVHPEINTVEQLDSELKFEHKLRTQIEINNLARAEAIKEKSKSFKPEKLDWLARRKQRVALEQTDKILNDFLKTDAAKKMSLDQIEEKRATLFRNSLAQQIGLYIEDTDIAKAQGREDYVKMIESIDQKSKESTLYTIRNNPNMAEYFEKLNEIEKSKIQLWMYANNFFQNYKEATTELEMVKPTDPAQPGRLQKLRQTEIVRNSQFLTHTLRTIESFGDDQSIKVGLRGAIYRNIPLASDLLSTHLRLTKTILPALTIGYAWNYYAWQVHMPFSATLIFMMSAAATISTPSIWLNRVFRMNGMKAMDSVLSKVIYTIPYAWVTFAGMFPIMLFSNDVSVLFSDYVRDPVTSVLNKVNVQDWLIGALAMGLITQKTQSYLNKAKLSEKAKSLKEIFKVSSVTHVFSNAQCAALFN